MARGDCCHGCRRIVSRVSAGSSIGPPWLFPTIVAVLLVPTVVSHRIGRHHVDRLSRVYCVDGRHAGADRVSDSARRPSPSHRESPTALADICRGDLDSQYCDLCPAGLAARCGRSHGRQTREGHASVTFLFSSNDPLTGGQGGRWTSRMVAEFSRLLIPRVQHEERPSPRRTRRPWRGGAKVS